MRPEYAVAFAFILVLGAGLLPASGSPRPATPRPALVLEWHVGDDFVAAFNPDGAPAVAVSGSGDRIEVSAMGDIDVAAGTATGSGVYLRSDADGNVVERGEIVVEGLIVFRSFGNGSAQGLPAFFEGGDAAMVALLKPSTGGEPVGATLWVMSAIGKFPPGQNDPLRLSVKGGPNYNESVHGAALFLALD